MTTDTSRAASEHVNGSADVRLASVAIVVPAYNEEANLPNLFRELEAATAGGEHDYRVILVDDGSVDATAQIAEAYRGPLDLQIVSQGVNKGLGAAILAGFRRALEDSDLDVVVTIEADTTSDLSILGRMAGIVADGTTDMAQGSMHHPDGRDGGRLRLPPAHQQDREPGDAGRHGLEAAHLHRTSTARSRPTPCGEASTSGATT